MNTATKPYTKTRLPPVQTGTHVAVAGGFRLPYTSDIEEDFGVDQSGWRALTDAVFPLATSAESVKLALSYCKARRLDVFKRVVHIVPVWSKQMNRMVDTVWPGVGELRTTAFRTGLYAGKDEAEFGVDKKEDLSGVAITFPDWCRITVYRIVGSQRVAFSGPKTYWTETYATAGRTTTAPNEMWRKRPRGQLEKCAEAAALRAAFPEELGGEYSAEEMEGQVIDTSGHVERPARPSRADFQTPPHGYTDVEPTEEDELAADKMGAEFATTGNAPDEDAAKDEVTPEPMSDDEFRALTAFLKKEIAEAKTTDALDMTLTDIRFDTMRAESEESWDKLMGLADRRRVALEEQAA